MDLILWRHAEAENAAMGQSDLERALTPRGHKQARRMADWLSTQLPENCKILVSPALRTLQTVEPLARKFKIVPALAPDADPRDVLRLANWPGNKEPVLIVGHQPTLGQLAALLLSGRELDWDVKKGNVWWISGREAGVQLRAVMAPELVGK